MNSEGKSEKKIKLIYIKLNIYKQKNKTLNELKLKNLKTCKLHKTQLN